MMRSDGSLVNDNVFDHAQRIMPDQDRAVVESGGRWGAVDGTGKVVVPLQFDWLRSFSEGSALFRIGDKEGRIGLDGNILEEGPKQPRGNESDVVLAAVVDGTSQYTDKAHTKLLSTNNPRCPDGRHLSFANGAWTIVDRDEHPISQETFRWVKLVCDAPAVVQKGNKWGFITVDGKLIADRYFDRVNAYYDGIAPVWDGELAGIIDEDGHYLLGPLKLAREISVSGTGVLHIELRSGDTKLDRALVAELARNPEPLTKPLPPRRRYFEGAAGAYDGGTGKWGFVDETGKFFIEPKFDAVGRFFHGLAWVAIPERLEWCRIDRQGKIAPDKPCQCQQPIAIIEITEKLTPITGD